MNEHVSRERGFDYEGTDEVASNPTGNPTMGDIIAARLSRRDLVRGALAAATITATVSPLALAAARKANAAVGLSFDFPEVAAGVDENHYVAEGYDAQVLLRWGDPIFADVPAF